MNSFPKQELPNSASETLVRRNLRASKRAWPGIINATLRQSLRRLTEDYGLSIEQAHLMLLDRKWYATHAGLLAIAHREGCFGIETAPVVQFCDAERGRWIFHARVYRSETCRGFAGYGDADPNNVGALVRGAEMRIAETRAVNRALRKAYGIGLCSLEELGTRPGPGEPPAVQSESQTATSSNGSGKHLSDRLLLLIHQQKLNPGLVKAYATDFCGVKQLRHARKEQVEAFIRHLAEYAAHDRAALLCQLNSYAVRQESAA